MGLDIFYHIAKKPRARKNGESVSDYINFVSKTENNRMYGCLKAETKVLLDEIKECRKNWIAEHPDKKFDLDCIYYAKNKFYYEMMKYFAYDDELEPIKKAITIKEIENWIKDHVNKDYYRPHTAYFRKVNCVYHYFQEKLEDEQCIVEKEDIIDIMHRAIRILENKDVELAKELLPTQSGFFFGSTDYDEYYFNDMVEILKQFGKLLNEWNDDEICYVYMSW